MGAQQKFTFFLSRMVHMPRKSVRFTGNGSVKRQRSFVRAASSRRSSSLASKRADPLFQGPNNPDREVKFFDTALSIPIDTTGAVEGSINLIPQGATESNRIGRQCTITSVYIRAFLQWQANMAQSIYQLAQVRFALVLDKQCNGANATYTDVYATNSVTSPRNLSNAERFHVLKEWQWIPDHPAVTTSDNWATAANSIANCPHKDADFYKKVRIPLEFSSTTGAITEIRSNNLFLVGMSAAGDDIHTVVGTARVRFEG